jgi:hypothetical protein
VGFWGARGSIDPEIFRTRGIGMEIRSTADALSYLYSLSLNESTFRFRGQANFLWPLQPYIYRFNDFKRYQTVNYESTVLQAKPPRADPPLTHTTYDLEWLMVCQHYGVPTRLLDWSADILISLFFACSSENELHSDGAIFICNQNNYPMFAAYNERAMESQELSFISTNIINPRMRMQLGCFMLWGHAPINNESTESYDLWKYHENRNDANCLKKLCIPQGVKKNILRELKEIYAITNESIFLKNGYLEKRFANKFRELKENARLITLYQTDADRLTEDQEKKARSMLRADCRNMFGNCKNLRKI